MKEIKKRADFISKGYNKLELQKQKISKEKMPRKRKKMMENRRQFASKMPQTLRQVPGIKEGWNMALNTHL